VTLCIIVTCVSELLQVFRKRVKRAPLSLSLSLSSFSLPSRAERSLQVCGTKSRDRNVMVRMRRETTTNGPSRAKVLPGRSCDTQAARAAPGVRSSSLEWPHRAHRHLVYPTASSWPEYPAAAKKRPVKQRQKRKAGNASFTETEFALRHVGRIGSRSNDQRAPPATRISFVV